MAANLLAVTTPEGEVRRIEFDRAFIGTGARPAITPIRGLADTPYLTSTSALSLPVILNCLLVIGDQRWHWSLPRPLRGWAVR